jgi:amidophosphoribosyltransferase
MCGIIGILGKKPIPDLLYQGMLQLQHRGQDAAGVFLSDPAIEEPMLRKRSGWVYELFQNEPNFQQARWGLGHIRYSTSGKGQIGDAQPLATKKGQDTLAIVHNGNLVNYTLLKEELEKEGVLFQTTCDSESILHVLFQNLSFEEPFFDSLCRAVEKVYERVTGAYSIIGIATGFGLFGFRDPKGIRPLLLGKGEHLWGIASETTALTIIGCKVIEDIVPGEVIWIDPMGHVHRKSLTKKKHSHCAFEFNYFAKTPTVMERKEIYRIRSELGVRLASQIRKMKLGHIDVVVPIPDTGNPAGIALSQELKIPFAEGFIRLQHTGRTFIIGSTDKRKVASIQKLSPIHSVFEGQTVLLVDDSIIRGTVSKRTIALAREAGAKRVLFASTFPPVVYPCIYGIDFPCKDQLIASTKSLPEIASEIGADVVIYNDVEALKEAIGLRDLCLACVTGRYPTPTKGMEKLQLLRKRDLV